MGHSDKILTIGDQKVKLDEPDLARDMFGRLYDVTNIDVHTESGGKFSWEWLVSQRGAATVIQGHSKIGAATVAGTPPFYVLSLVQEGTVDLSTRQQSVTVLPNVSAALVNANVDISTFTQQGTRTFNLRIDPTALNSHLSALVGTPIRSPVLFDQFLDLRTETGVDILRLAQLLTDATTRADSPLGSPFVIAHLREALFSLLLTAHESTASHYFRQTPPTTNVRAIKIAEEILASRASEPISLVELADLTGISLRSLERSYKKARGQTLRDFLKARRLELAHRRLSTATPGTTVTQILYESGFGHPGDFSRAYRERFGATPSETLRRALRCDMDVSRSR